MSRPTFSRQLPRAVLLGAVFALGLLVASPAEAQNPSSAQDRAQLLRTSAGLRDDSTDDETGSDSAHAVASPNDPDLGEQAILKRADEYQAWSFFATAPFSYTSNVALARSGAQSDGLFTPALGLTYAPRITKTLYANFSIAQQFFYYDEFDGLNFASFDARAGLVYTIPQWHNLLLRADYNFNRLTSDDLGDEFFANHSLNFGAELPFRIGRAQQVSVGTDVSFSIAAWPDAPARHDYSWFVGYSANLTRDLTVNAVGRLAVRDYVEGDRTDLSGILALGANYRFNKWLSVNAISTFATNDSNQSVFDYDVFNIGGALSVNFRF
ncbi:MAG: outer membrane beta-barrel protein [Chthoniobacterales bacterium]